MDTGDFAALMDHLVESALTFEDQGDYGFKLDGTKSNALLVLEQMIDFTQLRSKVRTIALDMLKYGDGYAEALDVDGVIERVQTYYPKQIYVTIDQKGNVQKFTQLNYANQTVAEWAPQEMIHFKWDPSDREPYSKKGFLDDFRDDWKDLRRIEQGMVVGRVTRAYPRNVHLVDVTNKTPTDAQKSLLGYVRAITQKNPGRGDFGGFQPVQRTDMAPNEDFFLPTGYIQNQDGQLSPRLHDIKLLDPRLDGLANIADVEYFRRKMFATVPSEIVGVGIPNLDPSAQHRAYARLVKRLQVRLEAGLRELFTQALVMAGVAPDTLVFVWPSVISGENWKFQDAKYKEAMTEQIQIDAKEYPRSYFLKQKGHTQEEIDEMRKEIKLESELFAVAVPGADPGNPVAGKVAQAAAGAKSGNSADTPNPTDGPDKAANRAAQKAPGAGGQNER
jgi:hypothetical protein